MWNCGSNISEDPAILADQDSPEEDGDENPERGNWTNKTESILSMIGYAVGLGNIWRFPYLAYKNGGGAFLIPYFLMLALCGMPLFFLESAIGQFCSQGPINVWRAVPLLQGVGFSMVVVNTFVSIYYNVIVAYSLYYMFASFQSPLPWSSCLSWADGNCSNTSSVYCNVSGVLVSNWTEENGTCSSSDLITVPVQSPSEQYWDHVALQRSSGLDETGPVVWHLALCLLLNTALVAAVLIKGIKSSGKVVYFSTTLPLVVTLILLIRGVTLEGAKDGLEFFIGSQSNLTKLTEAQVWKDAATQTFFSFAIATGGLLTLGSYSNFHNNMFLDTLVVTLINHSFSVFAGIAVFSVLGHMAHVYRKPIEAVVKEGFGLAFIAYPDALAKLPISTLWSILFFFMLFMIGLDSQFTQIEVIVTSLCDAFPEVLISKRAVLTIMTCLVLFFLGLPCVTRAGVYWVTLIDQFAAGWVLLVLALLELIAFIYIYAGHFNMGSNGNLLPFGASSGQSRNYKFLYFLVGFNAEMGSLPLGGKRLIKDIEMMIRKKSFCFWLFWRACWFFISPCIIVVILVWSFITYVPPTYGTVQYPAWGLAMGWCIIAVILIWIPIVAVYKLIRAEGSPWKRVKSLCSPSEEWHPYLDIYRGERYSQELSHQTESTNNKKM